MTDLKQIISDTIYSICEEDFNDDIVQDALIDMENEDKYEYVNYHTRKYGTDRMTRINNCVPMQWVDGFRNPMDAYESSKVLFPEAEFTDEKRLRILLGNHTELVRDLEAYADALYEQANRIYAACDASKHKYDDLKNKYGTLMCRNYSDDENDIQYLEATNRSCRRNECNYYWIDTPPKHDA